MNKSILIRLLAIVLLVVMSLSVVSCDKLPFLEDILGGEQGNTPDDDTNDDANKEDDKDETPVECQHSKVVNGKCSVCGEIIFTTVKDLSLDANMETPYPNGVAVASVYYVKATVKKIVDKTTGEMIIEDETGSITVMELYSEDETSYGDMTEKPVKGDIVVVRCYIEKVNDEWRIKSATLVSFESNESVDDGILTVEEAIEICNSLDNKVVTTERYLIRATIKTVTNPAYGAMVIMDETGEISVYGTYSEDGAIGYADMAEKPVKGDEVLLSCTLQNFDGTPEIKNARLIEFTHVEVEIDPSLYTEMTIAAVREAELGTLVKTTGVVAQITYANGYKPSGVILVDGTSSIYVYDGDLAGQVNVGNTVTIAGEKTYWILESETNSASKFGYKGACQIDSVSLLANDNGNTAFDKSWIEETTVKAIMDTPVTENITNKIFKATALVKRVDGDGFVNYYIDDLDGMTGSYVYTQCNGGDFAWLDQFDGKICTVYFVAINAKSSSTGCVWRFLPIEVIDNGYVFDTTKAAEFAVKYHGVTQFLNSYTGDPALVVNTQVSSELLGFEGATLSYTSSNEEVVYFTTDDNGVVTFHCGKAGTATVTVTGSYNGNTHSEEVVLSVVANESVDYISVADAIASAEETIVTVKGIVGPSVVNRNAFYLFGKDGSVIAVMVNDVEIFSQIAIGNEIIITGKREHFVDASKYNGNYVGQTSIVDAVVVANYYGNHEYSTEKFVTGKTVEDLYALDIMTDYSTTVFVTEVIVEVQESAYYTNIKLKSTTGSTTITLYCSSANQYSWLKAYAGQTVTLELAGCNWNDKKFWAFCAIAVVNEDGTKTLNTLNFK